jgi:hypothetical protein
MRLPGIAAWSSMSIAGMALGRGSGRDGSRLTAPRSEPDVRD